VKSTFTTTRNTIATADRAGRRLSSLYAQEPISRVEVRAPGLEGPSGRAPRTGHGDSFSPTKRSEGACCRSCGEPLSTTRSPTALCLRRRRSMGRLPPPGRQVSSDGVAGPADGAKVLPCDSVAFGGVTKAIPWRLTADRRGATRPPFRASSRRSPSGTSVSTSGAGSASSGPRRSSPRWCESSSSSAGPCAPRACGRCVSA